jgi:hypothetical protein
MSKKVLKKAGAALKKFSNSKVGKVVKVAAVVGGGLALGNVLAGGALAKGAAVGGKKLLSLVGNKSAAASKGLTAGTAPKAAVSKGVGSSGLLKALVGKGIGANKVSEQAKAALLSNASATIKQKVAAATSLSKGDKAQLNEVAKTVDSESAKVGKEFSESVSGDEIREAVKGVPTGERSGFSNSDSSGPDGDGGARVPRGAKVVMGGLAAAALGYKLYKMFS